jgi:serine/threonine protein phosphatase 1
MSTIAVGDIHGNLAALRSLLDAITPHLNAEDTLVFLGDYIDRGPDSKGCIEEILRLKTQGPFTVVTLLGNHEQWMLATRKDYTRHSWLLGASAFATIASYSASAAETLRAAVDEKEELLIFDDVALPYETFFETMPESHTRFFEELRLYYESDGAIFVHAGVDPEGGALEEQSETALIWGAHDFPRGYSGRRKVVYGHRRNCILDPGGWPQPHIVDEMTYGIDSIHTGVLTAIRMPDGKVFQSERFQQPRR